MNNQLQNYLKTHAVGKYVKPILLVSSLVILFLGYKIYIWANTQSTDNAYLQANITFLSTEISGTIKEVNLYDNAHVNAGDVIAVIDNRDFQANLSKAISGHEAKQQDINALDIKIELEKITLDKANSNVAYEESNLKFTEKSFNRSKFLIKDKFTSQQQLDDIEIKFLTAKNNFSNAKLDKNESELNLKLLLSEKATAVAELNSLAQEKILSQKKLDETQIIAPFDGVIASHNIRVGSFVSPGTLLCALVPTDKWYIKANFKETQIAQFKPGMKAQITIDATGSKIYQGVIRGIYPATGSNFSLIPPDNATGNFTKIVQRIPVLVDFTPPKDLVITPGMSATIKIRTN